jgi:hypothetical protein
MLRARAAVSSAQRRESPGSWWLKRLLLAAGAFWVLSGSLVSSIVLAEDPAQDENRVAVLFLLGPVGVASLLMAGRLRAEAGIHPLGEARALIPLSRRRSAAIATLEDFLSPETAFILVLGWVPWFGMILGGGHWLTGAGWATAFLAPFAAAGFRQLLLSLQAWAAAAAEGVSGLIVRTLAVLLFISLPVLLGLGAQWLSLGTGDLFTLPLLRWANTAGAPPAVFAASALMLLFATWVRSCRAPGWLRALSRISPAVSFASPSVSFRNKRPVFAMARMMAVQATRLTAYRYAVVMLVVTSVIVVAWDGGPGVGLLLFTVYLTPMNGFFNLYGADSRHYALWMVSGRSLEEWTRARQLFYGGYYALFGAIAFLVLGLSGRATATALAGMVPAAVVALAIALTAGPAVSRFTITPMQLEVSTFSRRGTSGRAWVGTLCAGASGGVAAAVTVPWAFLGLWWVSLLVAAAVCVTAIALRSQPRTWSVSLREQMALAFRT